MNNKWDEFRREKLKKIFIEKNLIIDIGGGLRVDGNRNNRIEKESEWLLPYIKNADYKVLDKIPDYNPDIVADAHNLPFDDNSIDAIICIAVLEHVEDPQKVSREIYRTLKPGGFCFLYVPFLYYYHPMEGYYKDFFRFTKDGILYLTRDFKTVEIENVRGSASTVANLLPFFSKRTSFFDWIDKVFGKSKTSQTSGYNVFCEK